VALLVNGLRAALDRRIGIEDYLVWSTVIAVLMFVPLRGTIQVGYAIALANAALLMAFDRLAIHRNHMLAILSLAAFSIVGASLSGTPYQALAVQILGISVMSVYFLSALSGLGLSVPRWLDIYMRAALAMAVLGIFLWVIAHILGVGDGRLTAIYSEPSYFIYVTLPALGYCINRFILERRYGGETLIFLLSYILADSALGFLGLLLASFLAFLPRLRGWQILSAGVGGIAFVGGLYAESENFRLRVNDFATAVISQDLSASGSSTFALLSNLYVTSQSFMAHPLTGIGIGGYANAYDRYIGEIGGGGYFMTYLLSLQLNRDDANSMILRIAAELGIPGLLSLLGFVIVCARVRGSPYVTVRNAILPYLIVRMARLGAYFTVELYFFVGLYVLNYLNYRISRVPTATPSSADTRVVLP
jgi:hypothetical protein